MPVFVMVRPEEEISHIELIVIDDEIEDEQAGSALTPIGKIKIKINNIFFIY